VPPSAARPAQRISLWDALDEGRDPTEPNSDPAPEKSAESDTEGR
jgi:hypothetical protein